MADTDAVDRHLLFGLLALQNHFIDADALRDAFTAWTRDKRRPLDQILLERKLLSGTRHQLLVALASEHLALHGDDPERSLAAIDASGAVRRRIAEALDGPCMSATLDVRPDEGLPRFERESHHADGGLGCVHIAIDRELGRRVALKEIRDRYADAPLARIRFIREAEVTGNLEHPNIVPVYSLNQGPDGRPYYAMRFIQGETLAVAIARYHEPSPAAPSDTGPAPGPRERSLRFRRLLSRIVDVCNAVDYAHSRGVLHRDLKPSNIMLGPFGESIVVDWGLARRIGAPDDPDMPPREDSEDRLALHRAGTRDGSTVGTPPYMSPEQARGVTRGLGPATDIYGLGAILYVLLTGRPPFEGPDSASILERVRHGAFPRPREVHPDTPPALEAICLKAMAHDPASRHPSARALAEEIEHWLSDEPVQAYLAAVADFERLVQDHPSEPIYRERWARSLRDLGGALEILGRSEEAEDAFRKGIDAYKALVLEDELVLSYREELANTYSRLGQLLKSLGRHADAAQAHRAAFAELERLVMIAPDAKDYQHDLELTIRLIREDNDATAQPQSPTGSATTQPRPAPGSPRDPVPSSTFVARDPFEEKPTSPESVQELQTENPPSKIGMPLDRKTAPSPPDQSEPKTPEVQAPTPPERSESTSSEKDHASSIPPRKPRPSPRATDDDKTAEPIAPSATLPPRNAHPRFHVIKPIARGSLGQVFAAYENDLDREIAIKEMIPGRGLSPTIWDRFLYEARITASLEHPNIIPIYYWGQRDDGRPFYAMRLVKGETLATRVRRDGTSPHVRRRLIAHLAAVCDAAHYAHTRGIVHRDIKPSNILISDSEEVYLTDWDLAKTTPTKTAPRTDTTAPRPPLIPMGEHVNMPGFIMGTPAYMSPEQALGYPDQIGPAADVYGLGATLYNILTRSTPIPFDPGEGVASVLSKVRRGEITPPRDANPDVPGVLEAICLKALALHPEERYPSAAAMKEDLWRWLAGRPVSVYRESLARRLIRRNRPRP